MTQKRIVLYAAVAAFGAMLPRASHAQRRVIGSVDLGTPIRVRVIGQPPVTLAGTLAGVDSVGVSLVEPEDSSRVLVRWDQTSLVQAQKRLTGSEAFIANTDEGCNCVPGRSAVLPTLVAFTGVGFVVGGIIGSSFKQGWERVWP